MKRVKKRLIVITGASSGIGKSLKGYFESQGDKVINISNDQGDYILDVSNAYEMCKAFENIGLNYGDIDILITCAGYGISGATELIKNEDFQKQMEVNFNGTSLACKYALAYMKRGAKIITISSASGLFPVPFKSYYCASKSAVLSFSMSLRMELVNAGIQVTTICPGDIKTNFSKNRKINLETNQRYGDSVKYSTEVTEKSEKKRMSQNYATSKIAQIIEKSRLKPLYIIGTKYKIFNFVTKFIPYSCQIKWLYKMFYKEK